MRRARSSRRDRRRTRRIEEKAVVPSWIRTFFSPAAGPMGDAPGSPRSSSRRHDDASEVNRGRRRPRFPRGHRRFRSQISERLRPRFAQRRLKATPLAAARCAGVRNPDRPMGGFLKKKNLRIFVLRGVVRQTAARPAAHRNPALWNEVRRGKKNRVLPTTGGVFFVFRGEVRQTAARPAAHGNPALRNEMRRG